MLVALTAHVYINLHINQLTVLQGLCNSVISLVVSLGGLVESFGNIPGKKAWIIK